VDTRDADIQMSPARRSPAMTAAADLLEQRSPGWLAAVGRRDSRRLFDGSPATEPMLDALEAICSGFSPHTDARVVLVRAPALDIFRGIVGAYGKIRNAPHVLVFVGQEDSPFASQHVGYAGEAVILEATRLGLDTCWVGGFFSARKVGHLVDLGRGERVFAVSPLGHGQASKSITEKTMSAMAGSRKRKCVAELAPGVSDEWPAWAVAAVETARLAPSAVNRQPWRFRLDGGGLVISTDTPVETPKVAKRLDCGIAMLHVELGAAASGVHGRWTDLTGSDVARFDTD